MNAKRKGTKTLLRGPAAPGVAHHMAIVLFKRRRRRLSAPLALASTPRSLGGAGGGCGGGCVFCLPRAFILPGGGSCGRPRQEKALGEPGGPAGAGGGLAAGRPRAGAMPRSFLVDSLVLREAGEKKAPEGTPPPLFPYSVPPPHALHGLSPGACHARKAGLLCVCPLCVTASQLHGPPGPPALPLLKASFPPFGSQYCHAPLGRQHTAVSPGVAHGSAAAAAAALYQTSYPLPDPRQFHCLSVGKRDGRAEGQGGGAVRQVGEPGIGEEGPWVFWGRRRFRGRPKGALRVVEMEGRAGRWEGGEGGRPRTWRGQPERQEDWSPGRSIMGC